MKAPDPEPCAWCSADIDLERPPKSRRGEVFCCRSHRNASASAVRRLHEHHEAYLKQGQPGPAPLRLTPPLSPQDDR